MRSPEGLGVRTSTYELVVVVGAQFSANNVIGMKIINYGGLARVGSWKVIGYNRLILHTRSVGSKGHITYFKN